MAGRRSVAERLMWVEALERSGDAGEVCRRFGVSRPTLRLWWRRWQAAGRAGLEEASRAPHRSPGRKVHAAEAARIVALRRAGLSLAAIREALGQDGLDVSVPTIRRALAGGGAEKGEGEAALPDPTSVGLFSAMLPDDAVFRGLAGEIAAGAPRAGEALAEERLARQYGASRKQVRAALQALGRLGLVRLGRAGKAAVAAPSAKAVAAAYAARRLIEAGLVRELARRPDPVQIGALRQHLRRQSDAERRGDKVALVRLLTEFHLLLAGLAGNPFLQGFVQTLASTTSLAVLLYDRSEAPSCAVAEHRALVRAIEMGREEDAARLMAAHLGHNQGRLRPGQR